MHIRRPPNSTPGRSPLIAGRGAGNLHVFATGLLTILILLLLTPSGSLADACPNEVLRSELGSGLLPDCRAYEMVAPPYQEGYPLDLESFAADGEKAILYSIGDLAGSVGAGEGAAEGSLYLDTRTAGGWRLSSLNPPLSRFVGQLPVSEEADDGDTLWIQHTPEQSFFNLGLWVRSGVTGEFSFIGPTHLPVAGPEEPSNSIDESDTYDDNPIAATSDYRHVVLRAPNSQGYWPFDHTEGNKGSLYEYSGTGNSHPILVGVNGPIKGSEELVGQCGTDLGGELSAYNALSSDGETIFFTVLRGCGTPASEVYARLHGSLVSPGPAETVHVSASECTVACGEEESGKNFEGASENGERVFFTSTQKLTNEAVDGTASGNAAKGEEGCAGTAPGAGGCNLYEYDFGTPGAECQTSHHCLKLVAGGEVSGVAGIAEGGGRVYFVSRNVISGAGENEFHATAVPEASNLYVYDADTGSTAFVATLGGGDQRDWRRTFNRPVQVAGEDGRFLTFLSSMKGLTPDDESATAQLFEYDAQTGELVRVSKGEDGFNENGNGAADGVVANSGRTIAEERDFKSDANPLTVSNDGRTVFFETQDQLSPRAVSARQGCLSVYEFHSGGAISQGTVSLVSDGQDVQLNKGQFCGTEIGGVDASGANVLFSTADPLLASDVDGVQRDVYDARIDGGFAKPLSAPECEGESCLGAFSSPPGPTPPASMATTQETPAAAPATAPVAAAAKPKTATQTGASDLAKALRACRAKHAKGRRSACELQARRRYQPAKQAPKGRHIVRHNT